MDLGIWTLGISDLEIGDPGSQNLDPPIDRPQGSIDRPQGIGPLNGPFWDPSDGPNPFSQRLNGSPKRLQMG